MTKDLTINDDGLNIFSDQKFNQHMKDVGKLTGLTGDWIIETQN